MLAPPLHVAERGARGEAAIVAPERAGFDLAKVIHYPLPHHKVDIMGLVQPLVERRNVEIVRIEEIVPRIGAWVPSPSLNGNKAEGRSG